MKLSDCLNGLKDLKAKGKVDIEVTSIENDSRKVSQGSLFVAIKGFDVDGHDYISTAIDNGAVAIVLEDIEKIRNINLPENVTFIVTENTRYALAIIACNFYGNPSRKFKLIGVTGTKGKTTTTYMIKTLLEAQGKKVGLIGTIENYIGEESLGESERTTPESLELQKMFAKMVEQKVEYVVMEVSSQALKLNRVAGCNFDIGVYTNFSKEHISAKEHSDMEDYFNSKMKLFEMCQLAYVNIDDFRGARVKKEAKCEVKTYGNISPLLSLGAGFDYNYSGRRNIYLNGAVLGYDKQFLMDKEQDIIDFSELGKFIDYPIKNYSSGMLAKLGFSIATMLDPDILIVDEVLGVGDVNFRRKSADKIRSLMDGRTTVLLVSHSIPQIRKLCDKAIWIDKGEIREIGDVNDVCDHYLKDSEKASKEQLENIQFT